MKEGKALRAVATEGAAAESLQVLNEPTRRQAAKILDEGTAPNTRRAYRQDWAYFRAWHEAALGEALAELPSSFTAVLTFVVQHVEGIPEEVERALIKAGVKASPGLPKLSTLARRLSSISSAHRLAGIPDPDNPTKHPQVREVLRKARRRAAQRGERPAKKRAATKDVLERLLGAVGDDLAGVRDEALLLFGWASGGRRRSEIAGAKVEDLQEVEGGYLFHLGRSKTDPEGKGTVYPVLGRAGEALGRWLAELEAQGVKDGPLFRSVTRHGRLGGDLSGRSVARLVQRLARRAGVANWKDFAAHSLRSGFATETGRAGVTAAEGMRMTGHRSLSVFTGYHEAGAILNNPAARLAD